MTKWFFKRGILLDDLRMIEEWVFSELISIYFFFVFKHHKNFNVNFLFELSLPGVYFYKIKETNNLLVYIERMMYILGKMLVYTEICLIASLIVLFVWSFLSKSGKFHWYFTYICERLHFDLYSAQGHGQ